MKKTLLSLFALTSALVAVADDIKPGYSCVEVRTVSGETTTIVLTDAMTTSFTESDIVFADGTDVVSLPLANLRTYRFVEAVIPEGIDAPALGLSEGKSAEIFTLDGRRVGSTTTLNLSTLQSGTYIVRTGNISVKITHK